jgi:hypothetical protein
MPSSKGTGLPRAETPYRAFVHRTTVGTMVSKPRFDRANTQFRCLHSQLLDREAAPLQSIG